MENVFIIWKLYAGRYDVDDDHKRLKWRGDEHRNGWNFHFCFRIFGMAHTTINSLGSSVSIEDSIVIHLRIPETFIYFVFTKELTSWRNSSFIRLSESNPEAEVNHSTWENKTFNLRRSEERVGISPEVEVSVLSHKLWMWSKFPTFNPDPEYVYETKTNECEKW